MSKIILQTTIKREKEKLYFCATNSEGFITVNEAIMSRGGRKKKK